MKFSTALKNDDFNKCVMFFYKHAQMPKQKGRVPQAV